MTTNIQQAPAAARPLSQMKPKEQIAHLLKTKQAEIAKMLPKHLNAERLLKVAQIAATTTPALAKCDVASLVGAIGQCAQMGLEPNTVLGHAYLVPFNTKRKDANGVERWVNSVQVIIGYKGLVDLARRRRDGTRGAAPGDAEGHGTSSGTPRRRQRPLRKTPGAAP